MNGGMNIHKSYMYELYWVELPGIPWFLTPSHIFNRGFQGVRDQKKPWGRRVCANGILRHRFRLGTALRGGSSHRGHFFKDFWKDDLTWIFGFLDGSEGANWMILDSPRWKMVSQKKHQDQKATTLTCVSFFRKAGVGHFSAGTGEAARTQTALASSFEHGTFC